MNLKTLLLAHKECPVAQSNGFHANAIQKAMPTMLTQQHMMNRSAPIVPHYNNRPQQVAVPPPPPQQHHSTPPPPPPPPPPSTSQPTVSAAPRFQRANMVGLPAQGQQESNNQGMITSSGTGGTSSVLRF